MKIDFPVLNVKMVPIYKVVANDYNPNRVARPELLLLKHSIEKDGYTQPIVTYHEKKNDIYIIVDLFNRYRCSKEFTNTNLEMLTLFRENYVSEVMLGKKEIPIVVINKQIQNRMASTIRHNRARGTHQIKDMSLLVNDLIQLGWNDDRICKELGMELDEVIKLKQATGLKEAFQNHEFSKSWEEFESKYYK